jgi:hypothetical protein
MYAPLTQHQGAETKVLLKKDARPLAKHQGTKHTTESVLQYEQLKLNFKTAKDSVAASEARVIEAAREQMEAMFKKHMQPMPIAQRQSAKRFAEATLLSDKIKLNVAQDRVVSIENRITAAEVRVAGSEVRVAGSEVCMEQKRRFW